MSDRTGIEWAEATWNPVVGCTPVSPGCLNCYAATMAKRLGAMGQERYVGLTVDRGLVMRDLKTMGEDQVCRIEQPKRTVFNGTVRMVPEVLTKPLHWRKPRRIFVNSMSDLFHEAVPFEFVDRVWAVMALCPQHTFLVLTKRPERMAEYVYEWCGQGGRDWVVRCLQEHGARSAVERLDTRDGAEVYGHFNAWCRTREDICHRRVPWPLPNVWLGASMEDQPRAEERIPQLLKCPAALRFLSCEPLLGPVNIELALCPCPWPADAIRTRHLLDCPADTRRPEDQRRWARLHWVIVGGESGRNSRPCCTGWVRYIVDQCRATAVPVFVKQLGANVKPAKWDTTKREARTAGFMRLKDRKGGEPAEWPEDLRVREWP